MKKPVKIHTPSALQYIAFLTGAALMVFELVAARILAPTIGSSNYIWTSVIGVIIAALSLGYWVGGLYADRRNKVMDVVWICIISAVLVTLMLLSYPSILQSIAQSGIDTRVQAVLASLFLFAPTSFILGAIHSYLAKLAIISLDTSGQSVAGLSALNSVGGIVGTFVTGFVLFNYIGSRETLLLVIVLLLLSSWLLLPKKYVLIRVIATIVLLLPALIPYPKPNSIVADIDSSSTHYRIIDTKYRGQDSRLLITGPGAAQSGISKTQPDELLFWYTQYLAQLTEAEKPARVLVLGGGAFTLPSHLAKALPDSQIDAVEIDAKLETIAKEYFQYQPQPNLSLTFEDARTFVNKQHDPYDIVIVDVYGDTVMPFTFLTQEFGSALDKIVTETGRVFVNVIGGDTPACQQVLASVDPVYRPSFPFASWQTESKQQIARGNYILSYGRTNSIPEMQKIEESTNIVFTDNFAPVDQLQFACKQSVDK